MAKDGILGRLSLGGCNHQFSWPRRSAGSEYYQVCVLCGEEYIYDWESMQRLGRKPPESVGQGIVVAKAAVRWHPRARRLRLSRPVRFRGVGNGVWSDGELKNISQSGLLFTSGCSLLQGARIEIELEMPPEICGSTGRWVRCDAQVVRTEADGEAHRCAAQVFGYVFIDQIHLVEPIGLHRRVARCSRRRLSR